MEAPSTTLDLSTEKGLISYLACTEFASNGRVELLPGGLTNWIWRVWLETPYKGHDTVIVKHGKSCMKALGNRSVPLERQVCLVGSGERHGSATLITRHQVIEVEAMKLVRSWLPRSSMVQVPEVYRFHKEAGVVIMLDIGEGCVQLVEYLKGGDISATAAVTIGVAIGQFMGRFHAWGADHRDDARAIFDRCWPSRHAFSGFPEMCYAGLPDWLKRFNESASLEEDLLPLSDKDINMVNVVAEEGIMALESAHSSGSVGLRGSLQIECSSSPCWIIVGTQ